MIAQNRRRGKDPHHSLHHSCHMFIVNNIIMETQESTTTELQNPGDVLLNPNRPKKEDWRNLLDEHPDMPQHFKDYIDQ